MLTAQLNESDSLKLNASLSLTGFWQGGNVNTLIFRGRADVSIKPWKKWVYKTSNSYVYQEFGKVKADEDILSLNFLYFNPEKKIYPLVLGFFSTNYRRQIDLRYLFGGGASFQLLQKESNWLKFSLTCEYENTDFNQTQFVQEEFNGNSTIDTFRGTIWVNGQYELSKKKVILSHESYFQPSLEDRNNYRWQYNFSLQLPIWKYLSFKIDYLDTFESIVVEGQLQDDRFLTFGLNIKGH